MKVLVACGAGASSTFVAMRVRRAAASRGLDITAVATSLSELDAALAGADVVLLGAHLAGQAEEITAAAKAVGTAVAVMPESVFLSPDGDEALTLALDVAGAGR